MDKAPTLLLQMGLDGSPASLWVLAIGLALALVVGALMLASLIKLLQTRAQAQRQLSQVAQDLRLSRDELNLAVEAAGDGHWNWDMRHSTPYLQGQLYGDFDLGDLSTPVDSARWSALIHPDDLKNTQAALNAYLCAPVGTFIVRFRLQDREGRWRWIVSRGKAIQLEANGRVDRMIGVHYDETARHEAELTAREEHAKFSGIFTTLPDAAGSSRIADGRYIEVNSAFERVLGYSRAEVVGKTSIELGIWANQGERDKLLNAYAKHGRVDRLEIMARTQSGQLVPGQMSASVASIGGEDCFVFVFRDLTAEKKIEAELNFSQSALAAAGRMGRLGAWVIYYDGTQPDYWSPMCREMVGISQTEPVPQNFTERFVLPEHRQALRDLERRSREQLVGWDIELAIHRTDGEPLWIRIVSGPVVENGRLVCTQGLMQDVDANHRAVDLLRQSEERFSTIFRFLPEAMAIIDAISGYYLDVNPAWEAMTGLARADVLGKTTSKIGLVSRTISQQKRKLWAADGVYTDEEIEITTQRGEKRTSLISMRAMTLNGVNCWITMYRDITERRLQQERLQHMAHFDALTGLPNRILLADRMKQAMAHAERTGEMLGVVYLDLDGFKPVNDRLGHSAGDELLKRIAERLPHAMRGADSVARLGGDEFVLLLASLHNSQDCVLAMQRAMAAICEPHVISGESVSVTASMGATLFPLDHSDADTLLRHADQAMYIAKQGGRNRFHFFDAGQEQATRSRIARLAELRDALRDHQFVLHLQPRVNMRTGLVLGAEALVRWQHPEKGLLSPAHFLPELEASELNIEFGEWVIASALALLQRWVAQNLDLALSINITARHLQTPAFSTHLAHKMAAYPQVTASQLEIEVTESGSLSDLDAAVNVIEQLHTMGIQVSLDDFGTGYSSLTYLRRLPVDTLKIDQSFVRDMLSDPDDRAIVKGVIGLAESFGLGVVAEGVETPEQGDMLLAMGCDMAQGYGIARPMPEKDLPLWVQQWQRSQGQ